MSRILAIDPGPLESAYVWAATGTDYCLPPGAPPLLGFEKLSNERLLPMLRELSIGPRCETEGLTVVIERVESYGMAVGESVFETVRWSGRFEEAAAVMQISVEYVPRREVKLALCGTSQAKDANVRQALIDRYGGVGGRAAAVGLKKTPGPLYGVAADVWSALAVAVTYLDRRALPSP